MAQPVEQRTLVTLPCRRHGSLLCGIILAPGSNAHSYTLFARSYDSQPNRGYYYNIGYVAIAYASKIWGARKLAISHLSSQGRYHQDIATCHAEVLAHFCDVEPQAAPESFVFCGCCITPDHLVGIRCLNSEGELTSHQPIEVSNETKGGATMLHLNW